MENENVSLVVGLNAKDVQTDIKEITKAFGSLKKLGSEIGAAISKSFVPVVTGLQDVSKELLNMSGALETTAGQLGMLMEQLAEEHTENQLLGGVSTTVEGFSLLMQLAGPVQKMLGTSSGAVGEYAKAVNSAASEVGLLSAIFPKLSSALASVGPWLKSAGVAMMGILEKVGAAFGVVAGGIGTAFSAVSTWVTGTLVPAITGALGGIASFLGISVGWVVAIIAAVIAAIVAVVVYWDEIKLFFTDTLPKLWSQFLAWISGIGASIASFFSSAVSAIAIFFTDLWNTISTAAVNAWNAIVGAFKGTRGRFFCLLVFVLLPCCHSEPSKKSAPLSVHDYANRKRD